MEKGRIECPECLQDTGAQNWYYLPLMKPDRTLIFLLWCLATAGFCVAQGSADDASSANGRLSRWLALDAGTFGFRYKNAEATASPWTYQVQYQLVARGRLKFDKKGRFYAGFRLGTGKSFSYSWNATGCGDGDFTSNVYLKELYFAAAPVKAVEVQFGGLGIIKGESTEITSYSNNGYLMGERVTLRRPERLFFDEISATGAYLGDQFKPGVFQRAERLGKMNYHQFLVAKRLRGRISFSADYASFSGAETLRQAVKYSLPRNRYVASLLFENYQRLHIYPAWGFAMAAQSSPCKRMTLTGGVVGIDRHFRDWNADKLGKGNRIYLIASYNFWREFSANLFLGKAFANDFPVINAGRYDLSITYDFLRALKRAAVL